LWDLKSKPLPRANAPPDNIESHLDYSHRGVGPYGPEADSQLPPPARQCQALAGGSLSLRRVSDSPEFRNSEAGGSYDYLYVDEQYLEGPSNSLKWGLVDRFALIPPNYPISEQ